MAGDDVYMRTTLTLDPDVTLKLKQRMREGKVTFKQAVNDGLRVGLNARPEKKRKPYKVEPWPMGLKPGIDPDKLNQLVDQLEVEEFRRKMLRDYPGH